MIRNMAAHSPGNRAGLERGDIIVSVDGKPVHTIADITAVMSVARPGQTLELGLFHKGESVTRAITLVETPLSWQVTRNRFAKIPDLGLTVASVTEKVRKRFNLRWESRGVVVTLFEGLQEGDVDLSPGDVIVQVNQKPVWKPSHLAGYYKKAQQAKNPGMLLLVENNQGFRYVILPVLEPAIKPLGG